MSRTVVLTIFLLCVAAIPATRAAESDTLSALRAELASGSLSPLLARQTIVGVPAALWKNWLADTRFESFAVTGFNENDQRYAARLRLHLVDPEEAHRAGLVAFVRVAGRRGKAFTVDQFHDYSTGLDLVQLEAEKDWLSSRAGLGFLRTLGEHPDSAELPVLAEGRRAALSLWIAQCSGKPCEQNAIAGQGDDAVVALWTLQQAFSSGNREKLDTQLKALLAALGDDPWLWHLVGRQAHHFEHCDWLVDALQDAWFRLPDRPVVADPALQCTLQTIPAGKPEMGPRGTRFLEQLSDEIGDQQMAIAIRRYFEHLVLTPPPALSVWTDQDRGE